MNLHFHNCSHLKLYHCLKTKTNTQRIQIRIEIQNTIPKIRFLGRRCAEWCTGAISEPICTDILALALSRLLSFLPSLGLSIPFSPSLSFSPLSRPLSPSLSLSRPFLPSPSLSPVLSVLPLLASLVTMKNM